MPKATKSGTTNRTPRHEAGDDWRAHQLQRRARGKGKYAMPHGRYSKTKKTIRNGVVARPAQEYVDLYLGDEHWVAAAVPAADQLIILANRDRAELGRMLACWQAR